MFSFLIKKNIVSIVKVYPILIHLPQSYPMSINTNIEMIKIMFNLKNGLFILHLFIEILKLSKYEKINVGRKDKIIKIQYVKK